MTIQEIKEMMANKNDFATKMGLKISALTTGHCLGEFTLSPFVLNPYGMVHGGCLFTLADTVGGCAALSHGKPVVTVSSNINYLSPAKDTNKLFVEATEVKYGSNVAVYDVLITNDSGVKVANASLSYFILEK